MLADFEKHFPGRCPICAYHRFGITEGFEALGSKPAPHDCIEANHAAK